MSDVPGDTTARLFALTIEELNERLQQAGHPPVTLGVLAALAASGMVDRRQLSTIEERLYTGMSPVEQQRVRYLQSNGSTFDNAVHSVRMGYRMPREGLERRYAPADVPLATYVFPPAKPPRGPKLTRAQRKAQKAAR